jgi:hypothetical protein
MATQHGSRQAEVGAREPGRGTFQVITMPCPLLFTLHCRLCDLIRADTLPGLAAHCSAPHPQPFHTCRKTTRSTLRRRATEPMKGEQTAQTGLPAARPPRQHRSVQRPQMRAARCRHAEDEPRHHARPKHIPEYSRRVHAGTSGACAYTPGPLPRVHAAVWGGSAAARAPPRAARPGNGRALPRLINPKTLESPPATCPPAPRARPPSAAARPPCRRPPSLPPS